MAASQLYEMLIVNPTHNAREVQTSKGGANNQALVGRVLWGGGGLASRSGSGKNFWPVASFQRDVTMRQYTHQFELDAAMWYGAMTKGPFRPVLRKIFHMFYYAGVMYRNGPGWGDWSENQYGNVAALLSHGQRVLVQIPSARQGGNRLWEWLNREEQIPKRSFATHGMSLLKPAGELIDGHRQYLVEKGGGTTGWGQSISGWALGHHFAFNVALGGEGNRNPFSSANDDHKATFTPIKADGLNGHVYVNYHPPKENQPGGMLIGCENAEHGRGKNPHTGAGHGLGGAQKVSACGGKKWSELNVGPRKEYNGLICDLTDRGNDLSWLLSHPIFNADWLDQKTEQVTAVNGFQLNPALRVGAARAGGRA